VGGGGVGGCVIMLIYSKAQENILEKIVNTSFIEFIPQIIFFIGCASVLLAARLFRSTLRCF
jgi:hypothetical protein